MPKRGDGNEQDIRVTPDLAAPSLDDNNPMTGAHPPEVDPCTDGFGTQTDITPTPPDREIVIENPNGGTTLYYDWSDISAVCPNGFDNRSMDLLIIRILKNHFARVENITIPSLRQFTYSDSVTSGIRIAMNTVWGGSQSSKLPALVVKRLSQKTRRVVIGDTGQRTDPRTGIDPWVRFQDGGHRILCLGNTDGVTEDLAEEVFRTMTCLSPILRSELPLHDFQCVGIGEVGFLDDTGKIMAVPVDVTYTYEIGWTTRVLAPDLAATQVVTTATLAEEGTGSDADVRTCNT